MGEWYEKKEKGEIYQFFFDRVQGVHFAGVISREKLAMRNSSVLEKIGIIMKGKK